MRNGRGRGFESLHLHVLTEEQEKDLDEMAKRFSETIGDGSRRDAAPPASKDTPGGGK